MTAFSDAPETSLQYWLGTDKQYSFVIYANLQFSTALDVSGFTTEFMVKRKLSDEDNAALVSSSGSVTGTFDPDPNVNTQLINVSIADTDTDDITPGLAYWELKRTDPGVEEVLAFGSFVMRRSVHVAS